MGKTVCSFPFAAMQYKTDSRNERDMGLMSRKEKKRERKEAEREKGRKKEEERRDREKKLVQ